MLANLAVLILTPNFNWPLFWKVGVWTLDGYAVITLDLASGQVQRLARLAERGLALVVDGERVYVATGYGSTVETINRTRGTTEAPLRVGRDPVALALRVR